MVSLNIMSNKKCLFWSHVYLIFILEIEAQIREIQAKKQMVQAENGNEDGRIALTSSEMDSDIYDGGKSRFAGYVTSIAANDEPDNDVSLIEGLWRKVQKNLFINFMY